MFTYYKASLDIAVACQPLRCAPLGVTVCIWSYKQVRSQVRTAQSAAPGTTALAMICRQNQQAETANLYWSIAQSHDTLKAYTAD